MPPVPPRSAILRTCARWALLWNFEPPKGGLPNTKEHLSGLSRSDQSVSKASPWTMCGEVSRGIRTYVWPNSRLSRLFMMWFHHPQRRLGDASREFAQFDAVELIHIHGRQVSGEHVELPVRVDFLQDLDLQLP